MDNTNYLRIRCCECLSLPTINVGSSTFASGFTEVIDGKEIRIEFTNFQEETKSCPVTIETYFVTIDGVEQQAPAGWELSIKKQDKDGTIEEWKITLPENLWEIEATYIIKLKVISGIEGTSNYNTIDVSTTLNIVCGEGTPALIKETSIYTDTSLSGTQTKDAKTTVNFFTLP